MKHDSMPAFGHTTLSFRRRPRRRLRALIALTVLLAAVVLGTLAWLRSRQPVAPAAGPSAKREADVRQEARTVTEPVQLPQATPAGSTQPEK